MNENELKLDYCLPEHDWSYCSWLRISEDERFWFGLCWCCWDPFFSLVPLILTQDVLMVPAGRANEPSEVISEQNFKILVSHYSCLCCLGCYFLQGNMEMLLMEELFVSICCVGISYLIDC